MPYKHRFSFCWSDELERAIKAESKDPYPIECPRGTDFDALRIAVEEGIDAHLEALFFTQSVGTYDRFRLVFEPTCLHTLVRRLMLSDDDNAISLAGVICETLDIELV